MSNCTHCGSKIMFGGPPCCDLGMAETKRREQLEERLRAIEEKLVSLEARDGRLRAIDEKLASLGARESTLARPELPPGYHIHSGYTSGFSGYSPGIAGYQVAKEEVRDDVVAAVWAHYDEFNGGCRCRDNYSSWVAYANSLEVEVARLTAALNKIDAIRNSIVGTQTVNWSSHIYPIVAALNEAGFNGKSYDEARAEALAPEGTA